MPKKKKAAAAAAAQQPLPEVAAGAGADVGGRGLSQDGEVEEESSPKPTTPPPTAQSPARVRRNIVVAASDDEQQAPMPGDGTEEEPHTGPEDSGPAAAVGTAVEQENDAEPAAEEDASRRAAHELAAAIAAEDELHETLALEQVNAEYMQEVATRQVKREVGSADKQQVVPKASGTDAKTQHRQLQGDTPDEQRWRAEKVRLEAEEAARELEKQVT